MHTTPLLAGSRFVLIKLAAVNGADGLATLPTFGIAGALTTGLMLAMHSAYTREWPHWKAKRVAAPTLVGGALWALGAKLLVFTF